MKSLQLIRFSPPILPALLMAALILSSYYFHFEFRYGYNMKNALVLFLLTTSTYYLPALVYCVFIYFVVRKKVAIWWTLPVKADVIGRALWISHIAIPLLVLSVAELCNGLLAARLPLYDGYSKVIFVQVTTLSTIVVNWGFWGLLRLGRFRHVHPRVSNGVHVKFIWPTLAGLLVLITMCEVASFLNEPNEVIGKIFEVIFATFLVITALAPLMFPNCAYWFNALLDERSDSGASQTIGRLPMLLLGLSWIFGVCGVLFGILSSIVSFFWNFQGIDAWISDWNFQGIGAWISDFSIWSVFSSVYTLLAGLLGGLFGLWLVGVVATLAWWYAAFIGTKVTTAAREKSLVGALTDVAELLPAWTHQGWCGLVAFEVLLFTLMLYLPFALLIGLEATSSALPYLTALGAVGGLFLAAFSLRCPRKPLALLPQSPWSLASRLQLAALATTSLPFLISLPIPALLYRVPSTDVISAIGVWCATAFVGQILLPYRLGEQAPGVLSRILLICAGVGWLGILASPLWSGRFAAVPRHGENLNMEVLLADPRVPVILTLLVGAVLIFVTMRINHALTSAPFR